MKNPFKSNHYRTTVRHGRTCITAVYAHLKAQYPGKRTAILQCLPTKSLSVEKTITVADVPADFRPAHLTTYYLHPTNSPRNIPALGEKALNSPCIIFRCVHGFEGATPPDLCFANSAY